MVVKNARTWVAAIVFASSALFIGQSLADDAITTPQDPVIATDSPTPDPTASPDPTPIPTESPSGDPSPSQSPAPSPSPSKEPPHAIANQNMFVRAAQVVHADPRANSVLITPIEVDSAAVILACISASNASLDILTKNVVNNADPKVLVGDFTNSIRITGTSDQVMNIINSYNGLRALSFTRGITNQRILFRFVAISEPTLDPKLCANANPSNNRIINILPVGIDIDMKKADVRLVK